MFISSEGTIMQTMTEYVNKTKIPSSVKDGMRAFAKAKGTTLANATRLLIVEGLTATGFWSTGEHTMLVDSAVEYTTDGARGG